jgi:ubiquinone/menaquinone biosynthesis C-methylase UbiE
MKDSWSAENYNKNASFVYSDVFTAPVLSMLDPKPGEKILDLGCGSGELTIKLAEVVGNSGIVLGVDSSPNMIDKARKHGLSTCFVGDAQSLSFPEEHKRLQGEFDAVFSNAALHWCKDATGVIESVRHALKQNGRFVGEMGGFMNCVGVRSSLHRALRRRGVDPLKLDPWYFPSPKEYQQRLEEKGFKVEQISLHPRLTALPGPLIDWLRTFARGSMLSAFSDEEAESIMREVQDDCEVDCRDNDGNWSIMYVRLRFIARSAPQP